MLCCGAQGLLHQPPVEMDPHFRPMHVLCELQTFPYDALVDLKNVSGMDAVSARMGMPISFSQVERVVPRFSLYASPLPARFVSSHRPAGRPRSTPPFAGQTPATTSQTTWADEHTPSFLAAPRR
jgi:hypothetical protein